MGGQTRNHFFCKFVFWQHKLTEKVKHVLKKVEIVENVVSLQVLACKHLPTELLASPGERAGMLTQVGFCCTLVFLNTFCH